MDTPMKSSAADRRGPTVWDGLLALCVAALAALLAFAVFPRATADRLTAVVTVDGSTIAVLPLYPPYASGESEYFRLDDITYPEVLEYKTGAIRVSEYHCPHGDCARVGWISRAGQQIVCLPNRLVITLVGEGYQFYDAITG